MTRPYFGQHLIVDAAGCNDGIRDREAIARFARALVAAIDMKAYGAPLIEHFGHEDLQASGYTLVQLIETSHIAAHFCDHTGEAYFDVFSCKAFDQEVALQVIDEHFAPRERQVRAMDRQAPAVEERQLRLSA
jgi:S-adenosylmethionine decarboxylase